MRRSRLGIGFLRVNAERDSILSSLFFFDITLTSRDTFESLIARKEFTFINSVTVVRSNGL